MKIHVAIITLVAVISSTGYSEGKHLFLLSGQSNMYHLKPNKTFTPIVEEAFGKDNVFIAVSAKRGAPIRLWDKDYQWPEGLTMPQGRRRSGREERTIEEFKAQYGYLYDDLIENVKKLPDQRYDSVTFVWMQGESDTKAQLIDQYSDSFQRIVDNIKKDLGIDSINIVIGRLSDCGIESSAWQKMREIQVNFAESSPNYDWVNTDDLNNGTKGGQPVDQLHYTEEGYRILGQRFAEKAIELIKKE